MSWFRIGCAVLLLVACVAPPAMAQRGRVRSDQDILIQLEYDWDSAFERKDLGFIDRVLADEFVATYADGSRGDRAKELTLVAEFNQQVDDSSLDEFIVHVFGNSAVVWFSKHMTGPVKGRPTMITYHYVDVFVMRDGRWQCVASQSTKLAESPGSQ